MEIKSKFITIPNVICNDNEISTNAKYLYGWIQNEIYSGEFNKTMNDITELLQCSISTARKNLKELKDKKYIMIEIINGNKRKITPLVSDSMIIKEFDKQKYIQKQKAKGMYNDTTLCKVETPQCVKDFIQRII